MIVIGIDPDSDKHGVAIYENGKLTKLLSWRLWDFIAYFESEFMSKNPCEFSVHIEDVCAVSASFMARDKKSNQSVKLKMAQHIGMCKQAQIELERVLGKHGIKVVKHKISKMWKKDKKQFELVTGWKGRSNEDTRSAAYFGWLGLKK